MIFIYAAILVILAFFTIYYFYAGKINFHENIFEDIHNEFFDREQLNKYAFNISKDDSEISKENCKRAVVRNLDYNYKSILDSYEYIDSVSKQNKNIIPAAEWMLDNLYLIEKEYKTIKYNMPSNYYRNLPVIRSGKMEGYPRVYYIAVELVSHTDGMVDKRIIEEFIESYQKNKVLTMGEMWALPLMIRIALIQKISQVAKKIELTQKEKCKAESVGDSIIEAYGSNNVDSKLEKFYVEDIHLTPQFMERLIKILRDNGLDNVKLNNWINKKWHCSEKEIEDMINEEHLMESNFKLSIGNCITSLRNIDAINWHESFENLSYVEQILRKDPSGVYEKMDFKSRDHYRHKLEDMARSMDIEEYVLAGKIIECCLKAPLKEEESFKKHVGYYLIDNGTYDLKSYIDYKDREIDKLKRNIKTNPFNFYLGTIIFGVLLLETLAIGLSIYRGYGGSLWTYIIGALALLIPCSEIVISIFNWSINKLISPSFIPKLELKEGIPKENSAIVVIPTLINNEKRVKELIEELEVYYLANREKNLYFAILSDFKDSKKEKEEGDQAIINCALKEIKRLNKLYAENDEDIFYYLSRYRQFNDKQNLWLGWERKRGKLMEFNSLIRGDKNTSYDVISGDVTKLYKIKYVITLDADTQLLRDSAKKLIGALSHILNKAHIDEKNKKVIRGYGIMQPRIAVSIQAASKTLFSKIFSGETGIDTYTTAVSDTYQDLFGEGIFTGKGIYDVDVFNHMLKDEIPENTVLSHDLLEGSYVRCALLTDVELIDGYPAYYNSSSLRLHRWVRGDWQLVPWLFKRSPINKLSKWKILDNLRRSLLTPSIVILIILALTVLPAGYEQWITFAYVSILVPILFDVSDTVVSPIKGIGISGKIHNFKTIVEQVFLIFAFIPYQAYLMLDAIIRTLYRVYVSKRNLLEWQTAADVEAKSGRKFKDYAKSMWMGSIIALAIEILAFNYNFASGYILLPSAVIWFLSPMIAYYISKDRVIKIAEISNEDRRMLRNLSRRVWAYFEDFLKEEDNWLAPDNYQEEPHNGVAHRTSPTNIGMGIISNIVAYDLGYIGIEETMERLENILNNMESLEKYKGHLYNWYNTETKEPLHPRYVSTVDSGNLAGYLWVTAQALKEYLDGPLINMNYGEGLKDTLLLSQEELGEELFKEEIEKILWEEFDLKLYKDILISVRDKCLTLEKSKDKQLYWVLKLKLMTSRQLDEIENLFSWIHEMEEEGEDLKTFYKDITEQSIKGYRDSLKAYRATRSGKTEAEELLNKNISNIEILINSIDSIINRCGEWISNTDFKILYDNDRKLFSIGYDIEKDIIGNCYYDLLASEARAASYIAIAKGDVDQEHWFKLGRAMTYMGGMKGLVSWSGTMFEYLMPLLIMKSYNGTLLDNTYAAVVSGQKKYAKDRKVPWGISESAFYHFDVALNYQYKAFGVPGIGLKRGLIDELVIAPYATVMALMINFKDAIDNMKHFISCDFMGRYGFYEAVDYTKDRIPKGEKKAVVKCFMVHHEGMSFMALDNVLQSNILQKRFHSIPEVKSAELLLQEKVPKIVTYDREYRFNVSEKNEENQTIIVREYDTANTEFPEVQLLSNGHYSLMLSNSGAGYAKKEDMMVYRWREDATIENKGMFFYIKNLNSNEYWSAAYEPCKNEGDSYKVIFSLDKAEFKRRDGNISTSMEVAVSSEDNVEVRRLTLTNHSLNSRIMEVTSYLEITLAPHNADIVHPTFSNLFISTEYMDNPSCVIGYRRPRAQGDKKPYIMQTVVVDGAVLGPIQYETSRLNFIGRNRDVSNPQVMDNEAPLKNTVGAVLDPIISQRRRISLKPGESCSITFTTGIGESKEEVIELARKYREVKNINRVFEASYNQNQMELNYLGIKSTQANLYQLIASRILFLNSNIRDREGYIKNLKNHQKDLWSYGISGDLPIMLILIKEDKDLDMLRQVLNAHEYLHRKGLKVDLVIINMQAASYNQSLKNSIKDMIYSIGVKDKENKSGGIFILNNSSMEKEILNLFMGTARLVIRSGGGSLLTQLKVSEDNEEQSIRFIKGGSKQKIEQVVNYMRNSNFENNNLHKKTTRAGFNNNDNWNREYEGMMPLKFKKKNYSLELSRELSEKYINKRETKKNFSNSYDTSKLLYFNGLGGFDPENNSYVIVIRNFKSTPAPWINVISNKNFGFHVSESGAAYTWNKNSRENKITPWNNDSVTDEMGEAIFIRDEDNGDFWSISPKPVSDAGEYVIEHGFGYSRFMHKFQDINGDMIMFVDEEKSIKYCIVKLKNESKKIKKLSLTYYGRMVLGVAPEQTAQYIFTNIEENFMWAKNSYSEYFGEMYTFLKIIGGKENSFTGNRREFIGRGGSINYPLAMLKEALSGTAGAGFDPCMAACSKVEIAPGEEKSFAIVLGQHEDLNYIKHMLDSMEVSTIEAILEQSKVYWKDILGRIQVETPDKSMNIMLNGWLMYQTIACRYLARTAFYQSGGAYGFRDQLQDSMAIGFLDSQVTKNQIIRSASRQYIEGDVQHWWHPVINSGIRTRFSDDLLWLPYVTADYIKNTGDMGILDEEIAYLQDEPLKEGEDERYTIVEASKYKGTLYEHCIKAIDRALKFGAHNIPLMGSGDWNDGMSTVGNKGKGESVWLGWFLYGILDNFIEICVYKKDKEKQIYYEEMKVYIRENLENNAWDGGWYRRAYFDDGIPLGSMENDECQIDSLSQSWSVISGAGKLSRTEEAMQAVERYLIKEDKGMILLLTPPFNNSNLEPGYIKGYVPGVRENGGQYTHASIWVILAIAKLGNGDRAWQLFNMINPINHSKSLLDTETYKVEPYVMCADIYDREPHEGRGGWSWYTGASGWMYKVGIEAILGLKLVKGRGFTIEPCIPSHWKEYKIIYKRKNSIYHIKVIRGEDKGIKVNGRILSDGIIPFGDEMKYEVEVII